MKRWPAIRDAFEQLLALPEPERQRRRRELERDDPELAREVASLLAHDAELALKDDFLAPPLAAGEHVAPLLQDNGSGAGGDAQSPQRIGPYEILRRLGRGGMGVVYLARRADGAYQQRVAIKVIQTGLADEKVVQRFQRERQVLANLEHPGIARLIEGGTAESGQPYLVMEYIDGESIERYCDRERLPVRARLRLFLAVCDAVQHAHQHLVVHRDLKPQNILVTPAGATKLLDFGIAKVLDPEKTSAGPEVTIDVMRFLTPAYASPEQVTGRPITTASDVYSLGAVLYQLLTGQLPYDVTTTSAADIERAVCTAEPKRPSEMFADRAPGASERARDRMGTPRSLAHTLHGDLDWIVLKALRKEPNQRYPAAAKFAEDLRNHLAGLPVSAHADTLGYRVRKFVQRHRTAVAAAALTLSALVFGLVLTNIQYQRAEQLASDEREQRTLAETRLQESRTLALELQQQRQTAETRLAEVERLNREVEAQRAIAERRFQDVQGFATKLIFDIYAAVRPLAGGSKAAQFVVKMGIEHLDRMAADAQDDARVQRDLAHGYARLVELQVAAGAIEAALAVADKAVAASQRLSQLQPGTANSAFTLAVATVGRARALEVSRQEQRAIEEYRDAIDIAAPYVKAPDASFGLLDTVYRARARLATLMLPRVSLEESLAAFTECRDLMQTILGRWPLGEVKTELALTQVTVADMLNATGKRAEARAELALALAALEAQVEQSPRNLAIAEKTRKARAMHAGLRAEDGDIDMARALLQKNRDELAIRLQDANVDFATQSEQILNTLWLLRVLADTDDHGQTLAAAEADLPLARELVAKQPTHLRARLDLATLLRYRGEQQRLLQLPLEAGQSLGEALTTLEALSATAPDFVEAQRELATVHQELGRAYCASAALHTDEEPKRRALTNAVRHLAAAKEQLAKVRAMGAAQLARDGQVAAELAAAEAQLAAIGS